MKDHVQEQPSQVQVVVKQNGKKYQTITLSQDQKWTYTIDDVPCFDKQGKKYEYTIEEATVLKDYYPVIKQEDHTLYLYHRPNLRMVKIKVKWDENQSSTFHPTKIISSLKANGEEIQELVLMEQERWETVVYDLPIRDSQGNAIDYQVEIKTALPDYYTSYLNKNDILFIINTRNKMDMTIRHVWDQQALNPTNDPDQQIIDQKNITISSQEELEHILGIISDRYDENDQQYEVKLTNIAKSNMKLAEFDNWLKRIIEKTIMINDNLAFAAFGVCFIYYRRSEEKTSESYLYDKYYDYLVKKHPFIDHYYAMYLLDQDIAENYEQILTLARNNINNIFVMKNRYKSEHPGVLHVFAIAVAEILEALDYNETMVVDHVDEVLKEAIAVVDRAITLQDYPKFYCTKGRLLALQGHYKEGIAQIKLAIGKESSKSDDYALRLNNYHTHITRIELLIHKARLKKEIENSKHISANMEANQQRMREEIEHAQETSRQLKETQTKNLEYLGLFAAIISFTIGGIQIATSIQKASVVNIAGLLLVLMGAVLVVFLGFGYILHCADDPLHQTVERKKKKNRTLAMAFVLSASMILFGIYLCLL